MASKPVFFDATGKRAARISLIGWIAAAISLAVGIVFVANLVGVTQLETVKLPGHITAIHTPELENRAKAPGLLRLAADLAEAARAKKQIRAHDRWLRNEAIRRNRHAPNLLPPKGRPLSIAFYPNWEPTAYDSLKSALPGLDWVIPTWLNLNGPGLAFKNSFNAQVYSLIRHQAHNVAIIPVIQNATLGQWDGPGLAKLLADPKRRGELVGDLVAFVGQHKLQGITVDFEALPPEAYGNLGLFLHQLSAAFSPRGWIVVMATPFGNDKWPFAEYARYVDYTLLMAYDEHLTPHAPGSIAGQLWYETTLDKRMKVLDPARTIIALGNYAYDWNGDDVDSMPFQDAVVAAHDSGATIVFDDATNNPHFSYLEDDGTRHDVWFLDGVTTYNEIHAADAYEPAGYALWRLGSEDPSVWTVMGKPYGTGAPAALRHIPVVEDIDFEGQGELLRVDAAPTSGSRNFEIDLKTGDIDDENYTSLPTGYVIHQFGAAKKEIALTFDDGPDPQWTPQILDILKAKHVHATFFIIGANAEANPGLVQRMVDEGHEVGNHTFTHPNLSDTSDETVRLELNATQRLFEALTGRSLRLFRPPYLGDAEPTDNDEIVPVEIAQDMGYIAVGEHVDPVDWELPGVRKIVARTLALVNHPIPADQPRDIILLHDAGGDRSQTVAALPVIIDRLRAEGYRFVPVSQLAGLTPTQAMPPLSPTMALMTDRIVFLAMSAMGHALYLCFLAAIWLGVARLLFLMGLSLWKRWSGDRARRQGAPHSVSVVIPAFNEEKVIARTVRGILASTFRDLEVIVVDDGSQDRTADVVQQKFGTDARVNLIRIPNGGKAAALNAGLAHAKGDVVVALDADTHFARKTIARLVRWFADPRVGAVAGNAKVGNRINMITRWQALEYIVAQNLERRALSALDTFTVVPGAVGAWRKSALTGLGGFRGDTVAEDQDLTIELQKAGYRVLFDDSAVAWTEAPVTFRGLAKQRFRWAYGTLQCLWKHRRATFNPRYGALGMFAIPQVWLFQILLTALAPVADLLLLWQLIWQFIAWQEHGAEFSNSDLVTVAIYYGVFLAVDFLAALFGFLMEKGEDWKLLWWLPLQRFGYRQLMYYVVVRSITTAVRGAFVGWGKLERTGTVAVPQPQESA